MTTPKKTADALIVDPKAVTPDSGSPYPPPYNESVAGRHRHRLSPVIGLGKFGANLVRLEPGAASSARHWHSEQDEFVYVVSGTATLVTDEGETEMAAGMAAGFPAGNANGHQLVNRSDTDVWYLEVGDRPPSEDVTYPDIDMANAVIDGRPPLTRKGRHAVQRLIVAGVRSTPIKTRQEVSGRRRRQECADPSWAASAAGGRCRGPAAPTGR